MKQLIIIAAMLLLGMVAASAQTASAISNNPQPLILTDHPEHATTHAMATEDNLRGSAAYSFEQGTRPLWEFPSEKHETPLGDIARSCRKDHALDRKAVIVVEN